MKSTHIAEVVQFEILPHPNADKLALAKIGEAIVVINKESWNTNRGVYIPPENLVPTSHPAFKFLADGNKEKVKVKAKKLRGVWSYGLLVPAPSWAKVGDDLTQHFGIEHYEPEFEFSTRGDNVKPPQIHQLGLQKYDVDSYFKYARLFEGLDVGASVKVNGSNARYVYKDGQIYCGSRSFWKKDDPKDLWWQALRNSEYLTDFLLNNPETLIWGEVYGHVSGYKYGLNQPQFIGFDIVKEGKFLNVEDAKSLAIDWNIPWVPTMYEGPFDLEKLKEISQSPCPLHKDTLNEGIVVRPLEEKWDASLGRLIVKIVNPEYLSKK